MCLLDLVTNTTLELEIFLAKEIEFILHQFCREQYFDTP